VLVISGIGNPERAHLREICVGMGGSYRPDWTSDSTHLVCAMAGTDKHKQAAGTGTLDNLEGYFMLSKLFFVLRLSL